MKEGKKMSKSNETGYSLKKNMKNKVIDITLERVKKKKKQFLRLWDANNSQLEPIATN